MPNVNEQFQGATLILPGVYTADNVSATLPTNGTPPPPLLFIGFGDGNEPQTLQFYSDAQSLTDSLRGGPCAEFVPFLTNPSNELAGAQLITYINVGANTQSSLALLTSGSTTAIMLTSADYGVPSNLLQAEVQTGTVTGKKLTLYDAYMAQFSASGGQSTLTGDNLGVPFQLAYIGTAVSGVSYTVTLSGSNAITLSVTSPNQGESFSFPLGTGTYSTVTALVEALNGTGYYSAQVVSSTNGQLPTNELDAAATISLPIPVSGVAQYVNVTATLGDVVYWVNTFASAMATAVQSITPSVPADAVVNIPFTNFMGGTNVVPTTQDYADAFNLALTTPGWVVFADSNSAAVVAQGTQHAVTASSITEHRFRRFITGSSLGDTIATSVANARSMNAKEATYCYPGIYRTSTQTGQNVAYGGLAVAAAVAGLMAGNRVAEPVTNKALVGNGVEVTLAVAQINQLQQAGILVTRVPSSTGVPTVVSDLTTWQNDNNPENVFNQQVACRQDLQYGFISVLQPYVGQIDSGGTSLGKVKNAVVSYLNGKVYSGTGSSGTLSSWDSTSLALTFTGATQTLAVKVDVVFVGQNRFITVFVPVQPLNASV